MTNHTTLHLASLPNLHHPPQLQRLHQENVGGASRYVRPHTYRSNISPFISPYSVDPWPMDSLDVTTVVANAATSPLELQDYIPALSEEHLCDVAARLETVFLTTQNNDSKSDSARVTNDLFHKLDLSNNSIRR